MGRSGPWLIVPPATFSMRCEIHEPACAAGSWQGAAKVELALYLGCVRSASDGCFPLPLPLSPGERLE